MTGFPHSSLSSQTERTSFRRAPYSASTSQVIGCYYNEGIPGGSYCTVDIFEEGAYIIEGISGDDNFTDGNKQDCNHIKDPGVEA